MSSLLDDIDDPEPNRVLCWFSCGAPSAVAAKLALQEFPNALICRIVIDTEHEDSNRFAAEVSKWIGKPITELRSQYHDQYEAILSSGFIKNENGAKCTTELKKKVRGAFQRHGDLHIFGYDVTEQGRIDKLETNHPDLWFRCPLKEAGLNKSDCKLIIQNAGIELPEMYRLGYKNNNCIGCVKGGIGYWNKIRIDFPEAFARMAETERKVGYAVLRFRSGPREGEPCYLDELDPKAGRFSEDQPGECGPLCQDAIELLC